MFRNFKYHIIIVCVAILVISSPFLLFYNRTKNTIITEAGDRAKQIASAVATFLEEDINSYRKLNQMSSLETEGFEKQYYTNMLILFQKLKVRTGANYIYTEKMISNDTVSYVLDAEPTDSINFSPFGSLDSISPLEQEAFIENKPTATALIVDPKWGAYVTGFAPILDSSNNTVIGLVGVDIANNEILVVLDKLSRTLLLIYAGISATTSILLVIAFNRLLSTINKDFLTGLKSRRAFEDTLQNMIKRYHGKGIDFSILMIDINNFKEVNDTYGHSTGDYVLKRVSHLLRSYLNETDFAFRYGGDEFIVILPNTVKEQATFMAKRISDEFENAIFRISETETIKIFVSVGVAQYDPSVSASAFIQSADDDMYRNKPSNSKKLGL